MTDTPLPGTNPNLPAPIQPTHALSAFGASGRRSAPPAADEPSFPWMQYVDALKRNWWIVVLMTMLGGFAGVYLKRHSVPLYRVDVKITVARRGNPQERGGPIRAPQFFTPAVLDELLRTNNIVDPVIRRLRLNINFDNPADTALARAFVLDSVFQPGVYRLVVDSIGSTFALSRKQDEAVSRGAVGDSIGRHLGFLWAPRAELLTPRRVVEFRVAALRAASNELRSQLKTNTPGVDGGFMLLQFTGTNPPRMVETLNQWATEFVAAANELATGSLAGQTEFMRQQVGAALDQLTRAEAAYRTFRERNALLPIDGAIPAGNPGTPGLQVTRDALSRDITALDGILRRAEGRPDGFHADDFITVPGVLTGPRAPPLNAALLQLTAAQATYDGYRKLYADSSRFVVDARAARDSLSRVVIPGIVRLLLQSMREQEQGLGVQINTDTTAMRAAPARFFEEQRLRQNYTRADALYAQVKGDYDRVRLAELQTEPDVKIRDLAEIPLGPFANRGLQFFMIAVGAGFAAGLGLAFLRGFVDPLFRYPEQATVELGLTIVGTVPKFRANRRGQLSVTAQSQVLESFRALRLSVRHYFAPDDPVVVCISSPGTGEGKSLVSSNLAIAFANAGHKTLLIDGDVRRGVVHTTFDMPRRPGLVECLAGSVTAESVVRATTTENLSVITSGARSRRAPELLVSESLASLIAAMRAKFDVVVVDSAPFAAGMDAYALGAAAGTMLVVLRPGVTDRKLASMRLNALDRLPVGIIGAVVNGIAGTGVYRYYYSDYSEYAIDEVDEDIETGPLAARPRLIRPT